MAHKDMYYRKGELSTGGSAIRRDWRAPVTATVLQKLDAAGKHLLEIINEVLDFSKIEAGKLVLENIPFNLRDLIQDCLTILAPACTNTPRSARGTRSRAQPQASRKPMTVASRK